MAVKIKVEVLYYIHLHILSNFLGNYSASKKLNCYRT